jgi:hypothetical protein
MPNTDPAAAAKLKVSMECDADQAFAIPGQPVGSGRYQADFTIDGSCGIRKLVFWLAPGAPVTLTALRLDRIAP